MGRDRQARLEQWRGDWWREHLCPACKAGKYADCDPVRWFCESAVPLWLTDYERDD